MRYLVAVCLMLVALISDVYAQPSSAGPGFRPPLTAEDAKSRRGLEPATVDRYIDTVRRVHQYRGYEGRNEELKALSYGEIPLKVAAWFDIARGGEDLFDPPAADGAYTVYSAAVQSLDAVAISLYVDLRALDPSSEVWVLAPVSGAALGPYSPADQGEEEGLWLPTIEGDTAVLTIRTTAQETPPVSVLGAMHYYLGVLEAKALSCQIDLACEGDASVRQLASAVGLLYTKVSGGYTSICTGTLINNELTPAFEPYLITAAHCINTASEVVNTEVIWDYQKATCDSGEPNLSTLPHSDGQYLLATSRKLDSTLMQLNSVPGGTYGRVYVGWSTTTPAQGQPVFGIHHPGGAVTKISYGSIYGVDLQVGVQDGGSVVYYEHETLVGWGQGLTEGGSSGSALFNTSHQLIGTLSAGNDPVCGGGPEVNQDYYASFRDFYPSIISYVANTNPPSPNGAITCAALPGTRVTLRSALSDLAVLSLAMLGTVGLARRRRVA